MNQRITQVKLANINIENFKGLVKRSLAVSKTLSLVIGSDFFESMTTGGSNNLTKFWRVDDVKSVYTFSAGDATIKDVNFLYIDGKFFNDTILGQFDNGSSMTLSINMDDRSVIQMEIVNSKKDLRLSINAAALEIAFERMNDEEHSSKFDRSESTAFFKVSGAMFAQISNLMAINQSTDKAKNWVQLVTKEMEGVMCLVAHNPSFEKILIPNYEGNPVDIKLHRSLLKLIDNEEHDAYVVPGTDFDKLILESKSFSGTATLSLSILTEIEENDGDEFNSDFNFDEQSDWDQPLTHE